MRTKIKCLTLLIALLAVLLASTNLKVHITTTTRNPPLSSFKELIDLAITISLSWVINVRHHHHGSSKKRPDKGKVESICDDFSPPLPPADLNTTSILCVDRNGCCNFTTVQAAVDAIPTTPSQVKRTIVWINSGLY